MDIKINIADTRLGFNETQLAALNAMLKEIPVLDAYSDDKVKEGKRIRLEAIMVVRTREFSI